MTGDGPPRAAPPPAPAAPLAAPPLPYRGRFGDRRPPGLEALPLPPRPMPPRMGLRPLKQWRWVGVFGAEVMLCAATVRVGPARQAFWAIWDRPTRRFYEHTVLGRGGVRLSPGRVEVHDGSVAIELVLDEQPGVETVCNDAASYGWTCKQGGIAARGAVLVAGERRIIDAPAVIDDTAAYYRRHTTWSWSAGVGTDRSGRPVAWNLVDGVGDPPEQSERTVWIDGRPQEVGPAVFAADLSAVTTSDGLDLRFAAEAERERDENRLLLRSRYRQPFGSFTGRLAPGVELAHAAGVMEWHDVYW